jgi:signal transduction histidine kinase
MSASRLRPHLPLLAYLVVFAFTMAVLVRMTIDTYRASLAAAQREIVTSELALVNQAADSVAHYLGTLSGHLYHLSLHESFAGGSSDLILADLHLSGRAIGSSGVIALLFISPSGSVVSTGTRVPFQNCAPTDAFLSRLSVGIEGEPAVSRVIPTGEGNRRCLLLGMPVFTASERRLGSLVVVVDWAWMTGRFLSALSGRDTMGLFVLEGDGTPIYPPPGTPDDGRMPPDIGTPGKPSPLIASLLSGGEETFHFERVRNGNPEPMMGVQAPIAFDGIVWTVGVTFPRDTVNRHARPVLNLILTAASVVAVFLVIGFFLVTIVWRRSLLRDGRLALLEKERILVSDAEAARDELQVTVSQLRSTAFDLEESKRELEEANRDLRRLDGMKSDFLSTVSHELRTPLAVIIGYLSIVADGELDEIPEEKTRALQTSLARARQLEHLISDLLSLSRIERGVMGLDLSLCDPSALIGDLLGDYSGVLAEKGMTVGFTPPLLPLRIEADESKVVQVLSNLLDNAIKFSPEGSTIEIGLEGTGEEVEIAIADRGTGVPEGEVERIFDRFYQVDNSSKRRFGGAGIGLAVVKELTELHGGRAHARLREGGGMVMTVVFPVTAKPSTPIVTRPADREKRSASS